MKDLKPCPFCGSDYINVNKIDVTGEVYLLCGECGIEQPLYDNIEEAVKAWNRRLKNETD